MKIVVINESHALLPDQERRLEGEEYELLKVPQEGWSLKEMRERILPRLHQHIVDGDDIVFASPVPVLLGLACTIAAHRSPLDDWGHVLVFHNDHREKVELPDGRITSKVATEGWRLVRVA